tara:strand:+ start:131 stop:490 length:360 start_codon:yes stop_codon:yes gene_type:complete
MRTMLKAKIHRATVTESKLEYIGSITIDKALLKKVDIWPGEKVLVVSKTNGARLETYVIEGEKGVICVNGAASHLIKKGHEVIIMTFKLTNKKIKPKCILVDKKNKFVKFLVHDEKSLL